MVLKIAGTVVKCIQKMPVPLLGAPVPEQDLNFVIQRVNDLNTRQYLPVPSSLDLSKLHGKMVFKLALAAALAVASASECVAAPHH